MNEPKREQRDTPSSTPPEPVVDAVVKRALERLEASSDDPLPPDTKARARREAERALTDLAAAPVETFVPILAEREVVERLKEPAEQDPAAE